MTFLHILKQDCIFHFLKKEKAQCKSLGTLLDYSLLLCKKNIAKAQTQVSIIPGLNF